MSEKIKFEVSAKTARLIGRENISGVNGALLELVKNSYDADASLCKILFKMPFPNVRPSFDTDIVRNVLNPSDRAVFENYYSYNPEKEIYEASNSFSDSEINLLQQILFKYNKIIILDNGIGMTVDTIKNSWMRIGTSDKEVNYISEKGRVKTGAKGIGRFALDKLATNTILYTKNIKGDIVSWQIDWNSFDNCQNLSEIDASIDIIKDVSFKELILNAFDNSVDDFIEKQAFDTGTMIILSPTREPWTERLLKALNTNLRGINPLQSVDRFEIDVENIYYKNYSFHDNQPTMKESDYDYFVSADYDGNDLIDITIKRNEIDTNCSDFIVEYPLLGESSVFDINKFWSRKKFSVPGYTKDDYYRPQKIQLFASQIASNYLLSDLHKLGKFHFEFYFMKNTSSDLEITKKVNSKRRKELLSIYSGIKIYRDNFKVRPYGDKDTAFYDWIELGERSQRSPAAVTNKDAPWRAEPYQVIGSLSIGRNDNPYLIDMANREGLNPNEVYHLLVDLLQEIFAKFEYDRQYFLREFKIAKEELKKNSQNNVQKIIDSFAKKQQKTNQDSGDDDNNDYKEQEFSKEDYGKAVQFLVDEKENAVTEEDVMMLLSVSGIATNTFAHEISSFEGTLGGFPSQIKACLRKIVLEENYVGNPLYNPYTIVNDFEHTAKVISSWIGTLTKGVKEEDLIVEELDFNNFIEKIVNDWIDLLQTKYIKLVFNGCENHIKSHFRKTDLLLILNNFILNSAWFLENVSNRTIYIDLFDSQDSFTIQMENSGPEIDTKYKNNPYQMFELRETTKFDESGKRIGTGIGLWVLQKAVRKYDGEIFFHNLNYGTFGFSVKFSKENN